MKPRYQRLYQLQQKYQPSIPRHMHFLRLAVLREFSLPDGLLPVIRDPCQYYPHSKLIKKQYGIVQGYRYYRKLREASCSTPSTSRPDVAVCPSTPALTPTHPSTTRSGGHSLTLNKLVAGPMRKIHLMKQTTNNNNEPTAGGKKRDDVIDYVPVKMGELTLTGQSTTLTSTDFSKERTLPFSPTTSNLPDIANYPTNSSGANQLVGVDNLTYRNDSSDSDKDTLRR